VQALATAALDLNRTHATNPQWTGHARFHLVQQTATIVGLAALEAFLILASGPLQDQRFYLAAALAGIPLLGFCAALVSRHMYGGTLSDPNGIPPLVLRIRGSYLRIHLNVLAVPAGLVALATIIGFYSHLVIAH
jgi:hypothetical protein